MLRENTAQKNHSKLVPDYQLMPNHLTSSEYVSRGHVAHLVWGTKLGIAQVCVGHVLCPPLCGR